MTIQHCDVQEKCHAFLVEEGVLKPVPYAAKYPYTCGWMVAGTVKNCPKRDGFTEEKGEGDDSLG